MNYVDFLKARQQFGADSGFRPLWMPDFLFPFQRDLVEWSVVKGRAAIYADCGLGKTAMQLTWAQNVIQKTNRPVLLLTPLAVGPQTVKESQKFQIDAVRSLDGKHDGSARVVVANYQRLHLFEASEFSGVVCDESSILKNCDGATRREVTDFMLRVPYRLLCTATAAPNDFIELGTSSEALGYLGYADMLTKFFKKEDGKSLSRKDENRSGLYRFRGHSERDFWRWVTSWARAVRTPSDLGHDDGDFILPPLEIREHVVQARRRPEEFLFDMPAVGLKEQRDERRRTISERCEMAAALVNDKDPAVCWCQLNPEGAALRKLIPDSVEISGADSDEEKEEAFTAFAEGQIRVIITKPQIAGFGLNWQHCAHQVYFPSHSYEQWHQGTSRSRRFGQKRRVTIDIVTSEGERGVLENLQRKQAQAEKMFAQLVQLMNDSFSITETRDHNQKTTLPSWL